MATYISRSTNQLEIRSFLVDGGEIIFHGMIPAHTEIATCLGVPIENVPNYLYRRNFLKLLRGDITEDEYFQIVIKETKNDNSIADNLKRIIRESFSKEIVGMANLLRKLGEKYHLILVSDIALEWIDYIKNNHPVLREVFADRMFFSCDSKIKATKSEPSFFKYVHREINESPEHSLLIDDNPYNFTSFWTAGGLHGIHFKSRKVENLRWSLGLVGVKI